MNNNMTDILEQYIMNLFKEATEDHIIIKRSNVAQKFDCVPSQLCNKNEIYTRTWIYY